jgi:hypothetical protein
VLGRTIRSCWWQLAVFSVAALCPAGAQQQVYPTLDCVEPTAGGAIAHFGYVNTDDEPVTIFRGVPQNFFVEPPQNRDQPEVFQPGAHRDVFQTAFAPTVGLRWFITSGGFDNIAIAVDDPDLYCQRALALAVFGGGSATATSGAGNLACPSGPCIDLFPQGTDVTLAAVADPGFDFAGWEGDPDCEDGAVTLGESRVCSAVFSPQQEALDVPGVGAAGLTALALFLLALGLHAARRLAAG